VHQLNRPEPSIEQLTGPRVTVVGGHLEFELMDSLESLAVKLATNLPLRLHEPKLAFEVLREIRQAHNAIEKWFHHSIPSEYARKTGWNKCSCE
jgi:hypothetical protein